MSTSRWSAINAQFICRFYRLTAASGLLFCGQLTIYGNFMAQLNCQLSPWDGTSSNANLSHVDKAHGTWQCDNDFPHYNECPGQFRQLARQLPIGQLSIYAHTISTHCRHVCAVHQETANCQALLIVYSKYIHTYIIIFFHPAYYIRFGLLLDCSWLSDFNCKLTLSGNYNLVRCLLFSNPA